MPLHTDKIIENTPIDAVRFNNNLSIIYDAYNPNTVLLFILAVLLHKQITHLEELKHLAIDFMSGLLAMRAYHLSHNLFADLPAPSTFATLVGWLDDLLTDEIDTDDMLYRFKRNKLPIERDIDEISPLLTLFHGIYKDTVSEIGLDISEINAQKRTAFFQMMETEVENTKAILGTLTGQQKD